MLGRPTQVRNFRPAITGVLLVEAPGVLGVSCQNVFLQLFCTFPSPVVAVRIGATSGLGFMLWSFCRIGFKIWNPSFQLWGSDMAMRRWIDV